MVAAVVSAFIFIVVVMMTAAVMLFSFKGLEHDLTSGVSVLGALRFGFIMVMAAMMLTLGLIMMVMMAMMPALFAVGLIFVMMMAAALFAILVMMVMAAAAGTFLPFGVLILVSPRIAKDLGRQLKPVDQLIVQRIAPRDHDHPIDQRHRQAPRAKQLHKARHVGIFFKSFRLSVQIMALIFDVLILQHLHRLIELIKRVLVPPILNSLINSKRAHKNSSLIQKRFRKT